MASNCQFTSVSLLSFYNCPLAIDIAHVISPGRCISVLYDGTIDIASSTEARDSSPSLKVQTASAVLATMDFWPTCLVFGKLCQTIECSDLLAFVSGPLLELHTY